MPAAFEIISSHEENLCEFLQRSVPSIVSLLLPLRCAKILITVTYYAESETIDYWIHSNKKT